MTKNTKRQNSKVTSNGNRSHTNKKEVIAPTNKLLLIPIIFIVTILPLIVREHLFDTNFSRYNFYPANDYVLDYFLYYKQAWFIFISVIMIIIIAGKAFLDRKSISFPRIFIPLSVYAALAVISSIVSKYRYYSFHGVTDHFESVIVLLGYCLTAYYTSMIVQSEHDVKLIINCFLVSVLLLSILGLTQITGHDFLATETGLKMITPKSSWATLDEIKFTMGEKRVYLTLYNPNYVGVYASLAAPLFFLLAFFSKKLWMIPIYLVAVAGIVTAMIGSLSTAGVIGLIVALVFTIIILHRYFTKYFYISIPIILIVIAAVFLYNTATQNSLLNQLKEATDFKKNEPVLTDIQTKDDEVLITYNKNNLHIKFDVKNDYGYLNLFDDNQQEIPTQLNDELKNYNVLDERFPGFVVGFSKYEDLTYFYINIDGNNWLFTNQREDGSYYYINRYGKLDKIITAPSAVFTGYEQYASTRAYIWSRSIPLLKKNIFLGSGADTFVFNFPSQDYVNRYNYGYLEQLLTKPHSMYLQIGVQTGVLSLIAFLIFYGIYFVTSFKLYIKGYLKSYYARVGVSILTATVSYMVVGLTNDSTLTVAPIFWVLIGLGIAVNRKAKPIIEEEAAQAKLQKEQANLSNEQAKLVQE